MGRFPTPGHLVSSRQVRPQPRQSAGKSKTATTGKGNPWLAATLSEIVAAAARTDTFLGERYRRLVRRRGKHRAIVAVGNQVLTIVWHLLADPQACYQDLGPDFYWVQGQPATPRTRPCPPTRTPHRQAGRPPTPP